MDDLTGLELYQLMALITPVSQPEPISWYPQTLGWLAVPILVLVVYFLKKWLTHRRFIKRQHRFYAIELINTLSVDFTALTISSILKRCALYDYQRADIASLTGDDWAAFLNQQATGIAHFKNFNHYQKNELDKLKQTAIDWLNCYEVAND